jgi:hypothetical protein
MKPWWKSKTMWLNLIAATLLLAEKNIEALSGIIPVSLYKTVIFGLPIANIWLRVITSQGLSFKPRMPQGSEDAK